MMADVLRKTPPLPFPLPEDDEWLSWEHNLLSPFQTNYGTTSGSMAQPSMTPGGLLPDTVYSQPSPTVFSFSQPQLLPNYAAQHTQINANVQTSVSPLPWDQGLFAYSACNTTTVPSTSQNTAPPLALGIFTPHYHQQSSTPSYSTSRTSRSITPTISSSPRHAYNKHEDVAPLPLTYTPREAPPSPQLTPGTKRKYDITEPVYKENLFSDGKTVGVKLVHGSTVRERTKMGEKDLIRYRETRDKRACDDCRRRKKRCNRSCAPYIICLFSTPLKFLDHPEVARLFRLKPAAGHPLESTRKEIYGLLDISSQSDHIELILSQGTLSQRRKPKLEVHVAQFEQHPDLKTTHKFRTSSGTIQEFEMPRYCLTHLEFMKAQILAYINQWWLLYLEDIILKSDPLTQEVLLQAQKHSIELKSINKDSIVGLALMVLSVNRMIERNWTIVGSQNLGIPTMDDPEHPNEIPITPVMDTQLDQIIIQQFLQPRRERLLSQLQAKMKSGKREDWFEIILVIYILETNNEWLLQSSRKNAKRFGAPTRYNSIELAKEYFHASNILLAHFHHMVNGASPLQVIFKSNGKRRKEGFAEHQITFLQTLRNKMDSRKEELESLRKTHSYEKGLFWSGQMFAEGWIPVDRQVQEEGPSSS